MDFGLKGKRARDLVKEVVESPAAFVHDPVWGELASEMLGYEPIELREPIDYRTWGDEIDPDGPNEKRYVGITAVAKRDRESPHEVFNEIVAARLQS